jgi:hypothetical protein
VLLLAGCFLLNTLLSQVAVAVAKSAVVVELVVSVQMSLVNLLAVVPLLRQALVLHLEQITQSQ